LNGWHNFYGLDLLEYPYSQPADEAYLP